MGGLTDQYRRERAAKKIQARAVRVAGCLEFQGPLNPGGYGKMRLFGEQLAHRAAWVATHGAVPAGMCVMHTCDNRRCVDVAHLRLGSIADNNADRAKKGRSAKRLSPARLSQRDKKEIAGLVKAGRPKVVIAKQFGVAAITVGRVAKESAA